MEISQLAQDPRNARTHDPRNVATIASSLEKFGQQKPIVIGSDGVIIAGNGTLLAAEQLGWSKIAVVRSRLTGAEARAYAIADNRTAELAAWDYDLLSLQLDELRALDFDLDALGFNGADLDDVLSAAHPQAEPGLTDPDDIPAPPDKATTRTGDLWVLGDHRLFCGDSSSIADVDRLLDGAAIHLVNTDPPYNVKVEPRSNNAIVAGLSSFPAGEARRGGGLKHHQAFDVARQGPKKATHAKLRPKDRPLANDFLSDEAFDRMLRAWFGHLARVLLPGRAFYIWGGYANIASYPPVLKACELYFSQSIIWVKEHPVLTRKDFMGNHEWCFYGWRAGAAHVFLGPHNVPDVWSVKKVNPQSMIHLTEKPVELAARAMTCSSRPGEHVLDLFGGSGSTLIAAEQTQRRAFLMELDPLYCDVMVQRFETFTGKSAERNPHAKTAHQQAGHRA